MYTSALMAFLHHVAAFALVGALVAEVVLFKPPLTIEQARRIQRADQMFGAAATVLLVVGLLRVAYFEKGATYYFSQRVLPGEVPAVCRGGVDFDLSDDVVYLVEQGDQARAGADYRAGLGEAGADVLDDGADRNHWDSAVRALHGARNRAATLALRCALGLRLHQLPQAFDVGLLRRFTTE